MQKLELTKVYDAEIERSEGNPASKLNTRDSFYAIRSAREEIKSTNKIVEYYNRIIREENAPSSSNSSGKVKRDISTKTNCDVYISCRYGSDGPTEERQKLVQNLEKFGIKVSAIDSESSYSESIEANICRDMTSAKLVILMVTDDYASFESSSSSSETDASVLSSTGTTTNSLLNQHSNRLTTCDELEFIIETQKPFYILKLCRIMPISTAKLPITSSYASWTRGQPIPSKLTENLLKKIDPK